MVCFNVLNNMGCIEIERICVIYWGDNISPEIVVLVYGVKMSTKITQFC